MNVNIRKLTPDARTPTYGTEHAAGFDLYAAADVIIAPGETALIPTGLAIEIPADYEMQLRPRSGVTLNTKLRVANSPATIDSDYRGEVSVIVDNVGLPEEMDAHPLRIDGYPYEGIIDTVFPTYIIRKGERIAQAVIAPVTRVSFTETDEELTQTERGEGGFGSTGVSEYVCPGCENSEYSCICPPKGHR